MKEITLRVIEEELEELFRREGCKREIIIPLCNRRFLEEFDNAVRREIIDAPIIQLDRNSHF